MNESSTWSNRQLLLIVFTATLGGFLFGFDTAVISGTVRLVSDQFHMSPAMEGWYVGSALLGCAAGVAISGGLGNFFGRKRVMFLAAVFFALSALGCAASPNTFVLILFRLTGGMGIGWASVICPMYIAEMAPASVRGKWVSYYQLAITIGILVAYFSNAGIQAGMERFFNPYAWGQLLFEKETWRGMFAVGLIPAAIFLVLVLFIPESPRWLALKNRESEAEKILQRIGGTDYAIAELSGIRESLHPGTPKGFAELTRGSLKKPLLIGILLAAFSQFSGINAIIYYGPSILEKAGLQFGEALGGQVTIGIVNTLFTFLAIYYIDRVGRKPLLIWGIGGAVLSLLLAAFFFSATSLTGWVLLIPIILFIACFSFSFGPVTWVIISEIFPTRVRSEAVAISTMSIWIANWIVGQFFPLLLHGAGPSVTFLVFALFSSGAFYLVWKRVPETRKKSLEEIEKFWQPHTVTSLTQSHQ